MHQLYSFQPGEQATDSQSFQMSPVFNSLHFFLSFYRTSQNKLQYLKTVVAAGCHPFLFLVQKQNTVGILTGFVGSTASTEQSFSGLKSFVYLCKFAFLSTFCCSRFKYKALIFTFKVCERCFYFNTFSRLHMYMLDLS